MNVEIKKKEKKEEERLRKRKVKEIFLKKFKNNNDEGPCGPSSLKKKIRRDSSLYLFLSKKTKYFSHFL
jgi:hypothetical protein